MNLPEIFARDAETLLAGVGNLVPGEDGEMPQFPPFETILSGTALPEVTLKTTPDEPKAVPLSPALLADAVTHETPVPAPPGPPDLPVNPAPVPAGVALQDGIITQRQPKADGILPPSSGDAAPILGAELDAPKKVDNAMPRAAPLGLPGGQPASMQPGPMSMDAEFGRSPLLGKPQPPIAGQVPAPQGAHPQRADAKAPQTQQTLQQDLPRSAEKLSAARPAEPERALRAAPPPDKGPEGVAMGERGTHAKIAQTPLPPSLAVAVPLAQKMTHAVKAGPVSKVDPLKIDPLSAETGAKAVPSVADPAAPKLQTAYHATSHRVAPLTPVEPLPLDDTAVLLAEGEQKAKPGMEPSRIMPAQALPQPMAPNHPVNQIALQINQIGSAKGTTEFELRLDPEELGKVKISIQPREAGLVISVLAERPETLDLLRRHADELVDNLQGFDFDADNLSFAQGQAFADSHDAGPQDPTEEGQGAPETASAMIPRPQPVSDRLDLRL